MTSISISTFNRWTAAAAALALVIATGYSAADLTWRLLYDEPPEPPSGSQPPLQSNPSAEPQGGGYERIAALHLFGAAQREAQQAPPTIAEAPRTRLELTLRGVFLADEPAAAVAIIADAKDRERPYRIGDAIADAAVVKQIQPQRVLLERNGELEALDLPKTKLGGSAQGVEAAAGNAPAPRTLDAAMRNDFASVARQIRFQPVAENGELKGYRLLPKGEGRLLRQAGLSEGDLVTRVNDVPVTSPDGLAELMRQLDEREHFVLEVENENGPRQVKVRLD